MAAEPGRPGTDMVVARSFQMIGEGHSRDIFGGGDLKAHYV